MRERLRVGREGDLGVKHMGNDWTRLVQKAAELGGPHQLKSHYANGGRVQGLAVAAVVGAAWIVTEVRKRADKPNKDDAVAGQGDAATTNDVS